MELELRINTTHYVSLHEWLRLYGWLWDFEYRENFTATFDQKYTFSVQALMTIDCIHSMKFVVHLYLIWQTDTGKCMNSACGTEFTCGWDRKVGLFSIKFKNSIKDSIVIDTNLSSIFHKLDVMKTLGKRYRKMLFQSMHMSSLNFGAHAPRKIKPKCVWRIRAVW